ncbi:radical SAM [Vibrio sp. B1REV9]|uniref:radical SAM protein n=1 Tax=Vibrio sp. B1REV9 TaxID=2751179 RepID=UPI001AF0E959|nr:radical SAM protein [Vibrio sp. B1REV9]CAE6937054.1 radical SAM [Vibrio sp. B1REV9]
MEYRSSVFNVEVQVGGDYYLYNTLTSKLGQLSDSISSLDNISDTSIKRLFRDGFLVSDEKTVLDEYDDFFKVRSAPSKTLGILFTTTTECDLRCGYCFENRVKRASMNEVVFKNSIDWIVNKVQNENIEVLRLILFGGEPMLKPDIAVSLFSELNKLSESLGIRLHPYEMITNGTFNDEETLRRMANLGLRDVQITFDGSEVVNDKRRKSLDRAGKYRQIVDNLAVYTKYFKVTIKINFDKSTIETIEELLNDILTVCPGIENKALVKLEPIAVYRKNGNYIYSDGSLYDPSSIDMAKSFAYAMTICKKRGFNLDLSAVFPTPCMVTQENSYLLEPNGLLRSCISAFGMKEFYVGDVSTEVDHISREKYQNNLADTISNGCEKKNVCISSSL